MTNSRGTTREVCWIERFPSVPATVSPWLSIARSWRGSGRKQTDPASLTHQGKSLWASPSGKQSQKGVPPSLSPFRCNWVENC